MKFRMPFTGEYDPDAKTLTLSGETTAGNKSELVLPIKDPNEFMTFLAGCFREKGAEEGSLVGSLITSSIGFSMHEVSEQMTALILRVDVGGMQLRYVLPARNLTPEQLRTIGDHLMTGLDMIQRADKGEALN